MTKFCQALADVLEVETLDLDTRFRETPDWNSLKGFGLLVTLENDWSTPLTVDRFVALTTVRDLYREAFISFVAGLLKVPRTSLTGDSAMDSVPAWDSVMHLRIFMESEARFGVTYKLEEMPSVRTIDDFISCGA